MPLPFWTDEVVKGVAIAMVMGAVMQFRRLEQWSLADEALEAFVGYLEAVQKADYDEERAGLIAQGMTGAEADQVMDRQLQDAMDLMGGRSPAAPEQRGAVKIGLHAYYRGGCGPAAIAINRVLFRGQGHYVVSTTLRAKARRRRSGHVAVVYQCNLFDYRGACDLYEMAAYTRASPASNVEPFEIVWGAPEQTVRKYYCGRGSLPVGDAETILRRAKRAVERGEADALVRKHEAKTAFERAQQRAETTAPKPPRPSLAVGRFVEVRPFVKGKRTSLRYGRRLVVVGHRDDGRVAVRQTDERGQPRERVRWLSPDLLMRWTGGDRHVRAIRRRGPRRR